MNVVGRKVGVALDSKSRVKDKAKQAKEQLTDTPTNLKYQLHKGIEKTKKAPGEFKRGLVQEKKEREEQRESHRQQRQKRMDEKRQVLGTQRGSSFNQRTNVPARELDTTKQRPSRDRHQLEKELQKSTGPQVERKILQQTIHSPVNRKLVRSQQMKKQSTLAKERSLHYRKDRRNRVKLKLGDKK